MWACCTTRVKNGTEFTFKNGTRIKARDPDEALDILFEKMSVFALKSLKLL